MITPVKTVERFKIWPEPPLNSIRQDNGLAARRAIQIRQPPMRKRSRVDCLCLFRVAMGDEIGAIEDGGCAQPNKFVWNFSEQQESEQCSEMQTKETKCSNQAGIRLAQRDSDHLGEA